MHIPVLQKEVLKYLDPKPNENFIDCTIGGGGHAAAILERNKPGGKVLGIEIDQELYQKLKARMAEILNPITASGGIPLRGKSEIRNRLILVNDSFVNLKEIVKREKFSPISGILFDLGMSSWHLEESGRGFSFQKNEPLDMRYQILEGQERDRRGTVPQTAEEILNQWSDKEIEKVLREYGEERFARRITKEIIEERKIRPIKTTFQLVEVIKRATPGWYYHLGKHFATKTFQALRIAVNDELKNLEEALPQALEILKPGGRLVAISFHSLEDRIVKNFYRARSSANELKVLTKKPILPSREEMKKNPRSRSAKLRAAIKFTNI